MALDEQVTNKQVTFGWRESIEKINQAYSILSKNIDHLEIWLDASSEYIPNSTEIYIVISEFKVNFTSNTWLPFQRTLAVIQVKNRPDVKQYRGTGESVDQSLDSTLSSLKENVKQSKNIYLQNIRGEGPKGVFKIHLTRLLMHEHMKIFEANDFRRKFG